MGLLALSIALLLAASAVSLPPLECDREGFEDELLTLPKEVFDVVAAAVDRERVCGDPEDETRILQRGFVVVRGVFEQAELNEQLEFYRKSPQRADHAGRFRFGDSLYGREMSLAFPKSVKRLDRLLARWAAHGLVPTSEDPNPYPGQEGPELHVTGFDTFLAMLPSQSDDPILWLLNTVAWGWIAETVGVRELAMDWYSKRSREKAWARHLGGEGGLDHEIALDWHVDGTGFRGTRDHKFWCMMHKTEHTREHSNIYAESYESLMSICQAMQRIDASGSSLLKDYTPKERTPQQLDSFLEHMMSGVGCLVVLDPGDALFFLEDVAHRTQSMVGERIVSQFSAT